MGLFSAPNKELSLIAFKRTNLFAHCCFEGKLTRHACAGQALRIYLAAAKR